MANTSSLAWPNMLNVAQNKVSVYEDNQSVRSRARLLMLTEPTEMYNEPNQGVGLKRYMYRYNHDNVKAEICDRCKDQFALHDPSINAPNTQWAKGLLPKESREDIDSQDSPLHLKMTLSVETVYGDTLDLDMNELT